MNFFIPLVHPLLAAASGQGIIKPLGHHELLLLLLQLALLLFVSRGLGELMRRIDLPPVVGELLAGVLLGPSLFGLILPDLQAHIFPKSQVQSDLLSVVSWLGVLFLLIVTGIETDLNLIVRKGRTALLISLGGIVVPFTTGFGLGWLIPEDFFGKSVSASRLLPLYCNSYEHFGSSRHCQGVDGSEINSAGYWSGDFGCGDDR